MPRDIWTGEPCAWAREEYGNETVVVHRSALSVVFLVLLAGTVGAQSGKGLITLSTGFAR